MNPGVNWLLPDGLEEVLPPDGERYEALRRALLDTFAGWGYELVVPPLVEYLESLLTGLGSDLDLQTFKLTDLESGRTLGVRADMTAQAARIDAHQLKRAGPTRLCYIGTVLRTRREAPMASRSPVQVGAELYGHAGIESDAEIVALMLETLRVAGVAGVHLDVGHARVFQALAAAAGLDAVQEARAFEALQRKARSELAELLAELPGAQARSAAMLLSLTELNGGLEVLDAARRQLRAAGAVVHEALDALSRLAEELDARGDCPGVHVDLAELRGYRYHPGVVFAAFAPGHGQEIARGGRYDGVGAAFGRARPATGFSTDLRTLLRVGERTFARRRAILAPWHGGAALQARIAALRAAGECVIQALPGQLADADELGCDRCLVAQGDDFLVEAAPSRAATVQPS